jgi:exodeoxyribonuclease VII small subunit
MSAKLPKDLTFETALKELEEITRKLEEGKHSLEDSMELYERGVLLKDFCEKKLKEAEGKWMILKKKPGGEVEAEVVKKNSSDDDSHFQQSIFE